MDLTEEEIDSVISTAFALGYNTRAEAVKHSPEEEGRERFCQGVLSAAIKTFSCPSVAKGAFCAGCDKCLL